MIEKEMIVAMIITGIIWKMRCRMYVAIGAPSASCQASGLKPSTSR